MFFFERGLESKPLPFYFSDKEYMEAIEQLATYFGLPSAERDQRDPPMVWKDDLSKYLLPDLAECSHGKCAFCETITSDLQVYRFRPPYHARPLKKGNSRLCYLWLSMRWENLFPICSQCLPEDPSQFPVRGNRQTVPEDVVRQLYNLEQDFTPADEQAEFYYPGELASPKRAYRVLSSGELEPRSGRFAKTIEHFSLNRVDLCSARAETVLKFLQGFLGDDPPQKEDYKKLQFAGTVFALLTQLTSTMAPRFGSTVPNSYDDMMDCMLRWHQDPAFAQHLNSAAALFDAGGDSSEAGHQVPTSRATRPKPAARRKRSEFRYDLDHPRLTKVQINNYRSLEDISLELQPNLADNAFEGILDKADGELPQAPCLLILGENATGKSTILEAIAMALLPQSMRAKLDQAKSPQRLVLSPEYMGSDTSVEPPDSASVTLQFGDARQVKLTIQRDGDGAQIIGPEFNQPNSDQSGSSSASQPEIPMIFAYGAHRFYANKETRSKTRHVDSLFSNADPLPNPEPWLVRLEKSKRKAFNELVAALRHIIEIDGTFENIETISEPKPSCQINIRRRASVTDANDANDSYIVPQKLDIVSSGYRAVIALVCDIFYGLLKASNYDPERARKARALILIDEIEAHLHPRWKMTLLTRLRRALPNATIIATSHDPLCIRGMLPGEVVMMNRYQNEDAASRHREAVDPFMPDVDFRALTIEQLLTSDFFQLLSTDDGLTDHHFSNIRQLLEKEDNPNVMLGQSEIEALVEFRKQITDSLPYGPTEVSRLVQEALADYLANRRSKGPDEISEARKQAKQVLTDFLSEMLE